MIDRGKLISQNKPFNLMSLTIVRGHAGVIVKVALFVWLFPFIHIPKDTKLLSSVSFLETLRYYYKTMS